MEKDPRPQVQRSRRTFLVTGAAAATAASVAQPVLSANGASPNDRFRVGVMGLSRGLGHVTGYAGCDNVEVAYVCDVDTERLAAGVAHTEKATGKKPVAVRDFRKILDDPEIDAISIAAPNFWHTPAAVLACKAGKHVYVEKPGSYCPAEAAAIVAAARKFDRRVQMGNQRRSRPAYIEAVQRLHDGAIGTVRASRCFYNNRRGSVGVGNEVPVPGGLDFNLWQGPAPPRPYKDNLVHYNWHWHWHWGNGELGNNGVHALDISRWGLGLGLPLSTACHGGRYRFNDDQETPDTTSAVFDYGSARISWEGSSCHMRKQEALPFVAFYGDGGSLACDGGHTFKIFDNDGKETESVTDPAPDTVHFQNFVDAVRRETKLNAEIEDAQVSAMLCHLGNIAYRTQTVVRTTPDNPSAIPEDITARSLWSREYQDGWNPEA